MLRNLIGSWRRAVAPHWGAWIEISHAEASASTWWVAPHWGAWIEMIATVVGSVGFPMSHPTGVRGLKYIGQNLTERQSGRTPLGCVD